ncbi:39S ribosomal protein L3, mitochondrial [Oryzias melastigma]|uniref:39S ribosomal protein L3, mitochondrial n=1 Tax=Oryzias melastigma TaxID=30732 RepID=A0A834F1L3_ORYME|nr:39S ribosomal protein L3, mitochondrial [Oryzias melastigma]
MAAWGCRFILQRGSRFIPPRTVQSSSQMVGCIRTMKNTTWFEEHLTEDNQKYMRHSMGEEYRKQTAEKLSPLKDEPWPRHEWTEGRCRD